MNFKRKTTAIVALAVALMFLFSTVAFAALPTFIYCEDSDGNIVKADYNAAIEQATEGNTAMLTAIKNALKYANDNFKKAIVALEDGKVIDWQAALDDGVGFTAAQEVDTYDAVVPDSNKVIDESGNVVDPTVAVDKDALNDIIDNAQALEEDDYTADTWSAMQDALDDAVAVAEDEEATQEDVEAAADALADAIDALVEVTALAIASVSAIEATAVKVDFGTSEEDAIAELDATVDGTVEDEEETVETTIDWACEDYDAEKAGDYTFTGTLVAPKGYVFGDEVETEVTATVTVDVEPGTLVVKSVSAINATTVEATLEEAIEDLSADDFAVSVAGEAVEVEGAVANADNTVYTLTVDMDGKEGALKVNGVAADKDVDFKKPAIVSAVAKSATVIEIEFSEKVKKANAETIGNYTLRYAVGMPATYVLKAAAGANDVQANAVLLADGKTVRISIVNVDNGGGNIAGFLNSGLRNDEPYQIRASANIVDLAGNAADTTYASFTGTNLADDTAPAITEASYTASTGALKLTFDKAVKIWDGSSAAEYDLSKITLTATGKDPVTISAGDISTFDPVAAASVTGASLTLNVAAAKGAQINALGSSFAVSYEAGAFVDVAGNEIQAGSTNVTLTQGLQATGASYNEETRILTLNFNNVIDVSKLPTNFNGIQIATVAIGADAVLQNTSNSNTIEIKLSETTANATKTADRANAVNGKAEAAKDATDGVTVLIPDNTFTDVDNQKLTTIGAAGTTLKNITFTEDATAPTITSVSVTGLTATAGTLTIKFSEKVRSKVASTADFDKTKIKFYTTDDLTIAITNGDLSKLTKLATATAVADNDQVFTDTWKINLSASGDISDATLAAALNTAISADKTVVMAVEADAGITDVNGVKMAAVAPENGIAVNAIVSENQPNLFALTANGAKVLFFQSGYKSGATSSDTYAIDATEFPKYDTILSNDKANYALVPTLGGAPVQIASVTTSNTGVKATNGVYIYTETALVSGVNYTLTATGLKTETGKAIEDTANTGEVTLNVDGIAPVTNTVLVAATVSKDNDSSGTFNAGDTLILDFGTPIHLAAGAKATDITVAQGTATAAGNLGSASLAVDGNKLVITLAANSVVAVGNDLTMDTTVSKILNADDQEVAIDSTSGYNAINAPVITAPTVKTAVFHDANENGALDTGDTIVVTFTGKVSADPSDNLTNDFEFTVSGTAPTLSKVELAADGMSATLTINAVNDLVPGGTTINIHSTSGNVDLTGLWSTAAVPATTAIKVAKSDNEQPTVQSAKYVVEGSTKTVVFKMSEKVHVVAASNTFADNFTIVDGTASITGTQTIAVDTTDATQVILTLATNDVVVPDISQVKVKLANTNGVADANGNFMKFDNQVITITE